MPPGRAAAALDRLAEEMERAGYDRTWTTEVSGGNTVDDLIRNLQDGRPTILFGVWPGNPSSGTHAIQHAMVLAGYDGNTDTWQILDPGSQPDASRGFVFLDMDTPTLEQWWGRRCPWYQRCTTVVLKPGT